MLRVALVVGLSCYLSYFCVSAVYEEDLLSSSVDRSPVDCDTNISEGHW